VHNGALSSGGRVASMHPSWLLLGLTGWHSCDCHAAVTVNTCWVCPTSTSRKLLCLAAAS
jgi:hypothetical protein